MKDEKPIDDFPEAKGIAYTTYKRTDGFEVSLTVRDTTGKAVLERIDAAINQIKKDGGTPIPLRGGFQKPPPKAVEYVLGRVCPICGSKLVRGITKASKPFIRCSENKWNFTTKQAEGCKFIEFETEHYKAPEKYPERDINE